MASGIYLNESIWSSRSVGYNKKQNRRVVDLRWKKRWPCHGIRSPVAITKLPRGRDILEEGEGEGEGEGLIVCVVLICVYCYCVV